MKTCNKCKIEKKNSEFYKKKVSFDGLQRICKICDKEDSLNWHKNNKERANKRRREWRKNNKEKESENYKKWYKNNSEYAKEYARKYRLNFPFKYRVSAIAAKAKLKGIKFNLTEKHIESIWTGMCPIFKFPIKLIKGKYKDDMAELDRINLKKGYIKGNVVWLSRKANRIKSNSSLNELKLIVNWWENIKDAQ